MNYIFSKLVEELNTPNLTKEEKRYLIEKTCENYRKNLDKELNLYLTKQYTGAAFEIGSAAIPVGKLGIFGAEIGKNIFAPYLGRKIAQEIGVGGFGGALSSSIYGFGEGLMEESNPLETSIKDAYNGMVVGGALGGLGAKIQEINLGKKLQQYEGNIFDYSKEKRREYNADAKKYYQEYVQERKLNKDGQINFSGKGLQETLSHNPKQAKNFPTLVNDIKNSTRLPDIPNIKPEQKPNVSHYECYQGQNEIHKIEVANNGKKRYYFTQDSAIEESIPTNSGGRNNSTNNIIPHIPNEYNPNQMTVPTIQTLPNDKNSTRLPDIPNIKPEQKPFVTHYEVYQGRNGDNLIEVSEDGIRRFYLTKDDVPNGTLRTTNTGSKENTNNIIPHIPNEYNPNQMTVPTIQTLPNDENNRKFNLGIEKNVYQDGNHIFTPQEIGAMSPEEFSQNEAAIMQQMKYGLITNQGVNYFGYTNPVTGSGHIYSRENIGMMSTDEYTQNEKAINAQLNTIGIPTNVELESACQRGSGLIYVESYTRSDGTQVKGYYRAR